MLWGKSVLDVQDHNFQAQSNGSTGCIVRLQTARHEAAAVDVDEERQCRIFTGCPPVGPDAYWRLVADLDIEFCDVQPLLFLNRVMRPAHATSARALGEIIGKLRMC